MIYPPNAEAKSSEAKAAEDILEPMGRPPLVARTSRAPAKEEYKRQPIVNNWVAGLGNDSKADSKDSLRAAQTLFKPGTSLRPREAGNTYKPSYDAESNGYKQDDDTSSSHSDNGSESSLSDDETVGNDTRQRLR